LRLRIAARGHGLLHSMALVLANRTPEPWRLRLRATYLAPQRSPRTRSWLRPFLELARLGNIPQSAPFKIPGWPALRMLPADSYIASRLFWLGIEAYEEGEPAWWAALAASHWATLELGANVGLYTLVGAAAARDRVYKAVEPNPVSCSLLQRNLALNGLDHVCIVPAAAVGERAASHVALRVPDRDRYLASAGAFVDDALDLRCYSARSIEVPTVRIGELVNGIDLLKLDIEGLELEVLSAVRPWLIATQPTLVVEVLESAVGLQKFLHALLCETRYDCYAIVAGLPRRVPAEMVSGGRLWTQCGTRDVTLIVPERAALSLTALRRQR
jgi:FkbM family methyltransferase